MICSTSNVSVFQFRVQSPSALPSTEEHNMVFVCKLLLKNCIVNLLEFLPGDCFLFSSLLSTAHQNKPSSCRFRGRGIQDSHLKMGGLNETSQGPRLLLLGTELLQYKFSTSRLVLHVMTSLLPRLHHITSLLLLTLHHVDIINIVSAGLCWSPVVSSGLCWSLLVSVGLCLSVLVSAGRCLFLQISSGLQ